AADFALIPVKPSMVDLLATQDAVALARDSGAPHLVVVNDVGAKENVAAKAKEFLFNFGVPIAETEIVHRTSHITSMTVGKSAAEVTHGRDKAAAAEIEALWQEVRKLATKAVGAKGRAARVRAKEARQAREAAANE